MSIRTISAKVFRFDPSVDQEPYYKSYEVPLEQGMTAMDVLDHIYETLDGTLAYYDHAGCVLGICAKCQGRVNGKAGLFCQTLIDGDVVLDPVNEALVIKDLVISR